jgi:hypothetical protein
MDAFENLESVLADSVSKLQSATILEDVDKLRKACLWVQHCMEQRDAVGAYQWRSQIATLAQSLHAQLKAGRQVGLSLSLFPSLSLCPSLVTHDFLQPVEVEAAVQQAFADLKPILVAYKTFAEQMQAAHSQGLSQSPSPFVAQGAPRSPQAAPQQSPLAPSQSPPAIIVSTNSSKSLEASTSGSSSENIALIKTTSKGKSGLQKNFDREYRENIQEGN